VNIGQAKFAELALDKIAGHGLVFGAGDTAPIPVAIIAAFEGK
jgi:hypothetical protein